MLLIALLIPLAMAILVYALVLTRFYDIQKGEILLDGVNIANLELAYLRSSFAVVLQDVFLFSGTMESTRR